MYILTKSCLLFILLTTETAQKRGGIGLPRYFKEEHFIKQNPIKVSVFILLLVAVILYIAVTEAKKNEWFDEKELYSFSAETSYEELERKGYLCISNVFDEIPHNLQYFLEAIEHGKDCYVKVFEQDEQGIVAHIFYYRKASGYIQQISYDLSSEGATFLEYSDNITTKKDHHICSVILTPLEPDLWDYEFLLCQYKK